MRWEVFFPTSREIAFDSLGIFIENSLREVAALNGKTQLAYRIQARRIEENLFTTIW